MQQSANVLQSKAQFAAIAHKLQPFHIADVIAAVAAIAALGLGQNFLLLIKTDIGNRHTGAAGKFTDTKITHNNLV